MRCARGDSRQANGADAEVRFFDRAYDAPIDCSDITPLDPAIVPERLIRRAPGSDIRS